jgi:hypothetical protein
MLHSVCTILILSCRRHSASRLEGNAVQIAMQRGSPCAKNRGLELARSLRIPLSFTLASYDA